MALRLFLLRWLSFVVLGLPGFLGAAYSIGESGGRSPFFTEAPRPMPLAEFRLWLGEIPGLAWAVLGLSVLALWLAGLFLTAGAVELFRPDAPERRSVWRAVADAGSRALLPNLRVALFSLVLIGVLSPALRFAARRLADHGMVAYWTGRAIVFIYAGRYAALLLWAAFVGALAFWAHVIVVADRRRLSRRVLTLVPGVIRRRPVRGLVVQMAVGTLSLAIGAVTLALWAQSSRALPFLWLGLWSAALAAQSALWLWRVRDCCRSWAEPELATLRAAPDEPWRVGGRLRAALGTARARIWSRWPNRPPL